jgi:hypothetical protein
MATTVRANCDCVFVCVYDCVCACACLCVCVCACLCVGVCGCMSVSQARVQYTECLNANHIRRWAGHSL